VRIVSEVEVGSVPAAIQKAVDDTVAATLRQGVWGWQVTDCLVTVTHCDHRPPPVPAGEFRKLTPLVVAAALGRAGTVVCEPILRYRLELPEAALAATLAALGRLRAVPTGPTRAGGGDWIVAGVIAADRVGELRRQVPGLTGGHGLLAVTFDSYRPVAGTPPSRVRSDFNPFDRDEYLLHVAGRL
jgi:ribosomal protection tetracycline resistance protein